MDIHEYQAKEILAKFGVAVPEGGLAYSPEQAAYRARELGGSRWIVKAQVHAGGRGKAGGVKLCNSEQEIQEATNAMFGRKLVTHQTGRKARESTASTSRVRSSSTARSILASSLTGPRSG